MTLSRKRLNQALAVSGYMLGEARLATDADVVIATLAEKLMDADVPVDRVVSIAQLLNAQAQASARYWEWGKGARHGIFTVSDQYAGGYAQSPAAEAHQTDEWVIFRLADTPDERFGIVRDLKADGYTHYVCAPVVMCLLRPSKLPFTTTLSPANAGAAAPVAAAAANKVRARALAVRAFIGVIPKIVIAGIGEWVLRPHAEASLGSADLGV